MLSPTPVVPSIMPSPTVLAKLSGRGDAVRVVIDQSSDSSATEEEADPPTQFLEAAQLLESGHPWRAILNAAEVARERDAASMIKSPTTKATTHNNGSPCWCNYYYNQSVCAERYGSCSTLVGKGNENENNNNLGQQQYEEIIFDDDDDDDSSTSSQEENRPPQQQQQPQPPPRPPTTRQRQLPPGWTEHFDPESGKPYYYNAEECLTTWDRRYVSQMNKEKTKTKTKADIIAAAIAAAVARAKMGTTRKRRRTTFFGDDDDVGSSSSSSRTTYATNFNNNNFVPTTKQSRSIPVEVWSGPPDEELTGSVKEWPEGWVKKLFERQSVKTKGRVDRYWFTPIMKYKLRSMIEVNKFLAALKRNGGNEEKAKRSIS